MSRLRVSDHALLRFLERGADMNVEQLRRQLEASLERAHLAALQMKAGNYLIKADGLTFAVAKNETNYTVTTVLDEKRPSSIAKASKHKGERK